MARTGGAVKFDEMAAMRLARVNLALALEAFAMEIWSDAKQNHIFRNRTGELEKSIRVEKLDDGLVSNKLHYQVQAGVGYSAGVSGPGGRAGSGGSSEAFYALYVELGTKRMRSRPFLRPALYRQSQRFLPMISRVMRDQFNAGGR
jgi:HK97 gp10 family phage protein